MITTSYTDHRQQERIRQGKVTTEDVEVNEGVSDDDDVEWYRKEVGVVPDPGKFWHV